ncbi:MAG TPA: hypothetical protein EYQ22_04900 [Gammaproteobacteria bacterium]|nr:hypothetical protein [Gammaproteobacteria bacterium]HIK71421.1 hypothetical protein [Pseudomonadales bacterium]
MMRTLILLMLLGSLAVNASQVPTAVDELLDGFHQAAAESNFDDYFGRFADNAYFLGTDAGERWSVTEFKAYARAAFMERRGWKYDVVQRNIETRANLQLFWFDEILFNQKLGRCRGTGVIVREEGEWKIAHYSLSMLIPNEIAAAVAIQTKKVDAGSERDRKLK